MSAPTSAFPRICLRPQNAPPAPTFHAAKRVRRDSSNSIRLQLKTADGEKLVEGARFNCADAIFAQLNL